MTGFGRGGAERDGSSVAVEVRSVNSRYVEVSVRLPRELAEFEVEVQNRAKSSLQRGKISVTVQLDQHAATPQIAVDEDLARAYASALERLRFVAGIKQPVQLEHLIQVGDVLKFREESLGNLGDSVQGLLFSALQQALDACAQMRSAEGLALAQDLASRLEAIELELEQIESEAPDRVVAARDSLRQRVAELLSGERRVDDDRLEVEIALLAERLDIAEECVRLRSHIDQFRLTLDENGLVGRRLNFLSQELNREINTIASKANDAGVAQRAVVMKEELERIREQVQNVA